MFASSQTKVLLLLSYEVGLYYAVHSFLKMTIIAQRRNICIGKETFVNVE